MIDTKVTWPDGARCAVTLAFDFDAETLWLGRDPANIDRPATLSQGLYGAKVGVPSILQVLRECGNLRATFYVPGWTAEHHTAVVEAILKDGHEVAHHSYIHKWIDPTDPETELEEMEKGLEALKRCVGVTPLGYRAPANETSMNMIRLLAERKFLYDSTMFDAVNPYFHQVGDNPRALVELPVAWMLDDVPFTLFSIKAPRTMCTNSHILEIWTDEFRAIYQAGALFNTMLHPQAIGRPSRLLLLRELIAHMQSYPGVWFATSAGAARAFAAQA
jgi:peptidoglycan/xylan/chitin deacetylase (PgdA/CDA1 family)